MYICIMYVYMYVREYKILLCALRFYTTSYKLMQLFILTYENRLNNFEININDKKRERKRNRRNSKLVNEQE